MVGRYSTYSTNIFAFCCAASASDSFSFPSLSHDSFSHPHSYVLLYTGIVIYILHTGSYAPLPPLHPAPFSSLLLHSGLQSSSSLNWTVFPVLSSPATCLVPAVFPSARKILLLLSPCTCSHFLGAAFVTGVFGCPGKYRLNINCWVSGDP